MIDAVAGGTHAEADVPPASLSPSRSTPSSAGRERMLDAALRLGLRRDPHTPTVGDIIGLAAVSRASFYEQFAGREECFVSALAPTRLRLLADARRSVRDGAPERAANALTATLLAFAGSEPELARALLSDPLIAGPQVLAAHDQMLAQLAAILEEAFDQVPPTAPVPDVSSRVLVGVVARLLASRLRTGEPCDFAMLEEILDWLASYQVKAGAHRWRTLTPAQRSGYCDAPVSRALRAPPPLTSPRPGRRASSENHWLRIVFATAETVARNGYAATSVRQIARTAGLDCRVFYREFASKEQALAAVREMYFRHLIASTAGASLGEHWPERIAHGARALTQTLQQNPVLSYVALVESHGGTASARERVEELLRAFTIFLQEGYRADTHSSTAPGLAPSEIAQEAIVRAIVELCYLDAREHGPDREGTLAGFAGHVAFLALAPFLGAALANDRLEQLASDLAEDPVGQPDEYSEQEGSSGARNSIAAA